MTTDEQEPVESSCADWLIILHLIVKLSYIVPSGICLEWFICCLNFKFQAGIGSWLSVLTSRSDDDDEYWKANSYLLSKEILHIRYPSMIIMQRSYCNAQINLMPSAVNNYTLQKLKHAWKHPINWSPLAKQIVNFSLMCFGQAVICICVYTHRSVI